MDPVPNKDGKFVFSSLQIASYCCYPDVPKVNLLQSCILYVLGVVKTVCSYFIRPSSLVRTLRIERSKFEPWPGTLCWDLEKAGHLTLSVPLSAQVYKWLQADRYFWL